MSTSITIQDLLRYKTHQVQMMSDRGYLIPYEEQWLLQAKWYEKDEVAKFTNVYQNKAAQTTLRESLSQIYKHKHRDNFSIVKYLPGEDNANSVSIKIIKETVAVLLNQEYCRSLTATGTVSLVIISEIPLSPVAYKKINTEFVDYDIEVIFFSMLEINPSRHCLNQPITFMTHDEVSLLKKTYNISENHLAKRQENDIMVRYLGATVGQYLKINRSHEQQHIPDNNSIYYAVVIPSVEADKSSKMRDVIRGVD